MKPWYQSKKNIATILGAVATIVLVVFPGIVPADKVDKLVDAIVVLVAALSIGTGLADHGKEAAAIAANQETPQ